MIAPYFDRDGIKLYQGDCLEILPQLEPGSVDAVITDPPYGMNSHNMRNAVAFMDTEWDDSPASDN